MTSQYDSGPNYGGRLLGFLLALLLGAVAVVVVVRHATGGALGRQSPRRPESQSTRPVMVTSLTIRTSVFAK